jgi:hypothetical protein
MSVVPAQTAIDSKDDKVESETAVLAEATASVLVIIVTGGTRGSDPNISNLTKAFNDPYFELQVLPVVPPPGVTDKNLIENYVMQSTLTFAATGNSGVWANLPVIVVKDNSVTNITSAGMRERISTSLIAGADAGLCFLCKWDDACEKFQSVEGGDAINGGSSLKLSKQPTATQAIMYRPATRDKVRSDLATLMGNMGIYLNSLITNGSETATVFVPNIIDFDIDLATTNSDFAKLNECAPLTAPPPPPQNMYYAFLWFLALLILVFLVGWVLIQLGPR